MEKNSTLLVVAAAMVDGEGRVLLQQRSSHRAMAGLWEFPGGKVEPGELPEAALVRELREELGVEVSESALIPGPFASDRIGDRHLLLLLYVCREWQGEPAALDSAGLQWLTPAEMRGLAMPPADLPLIPMLGAILPSS